jgi:hypothetical protein
MALSEKPYCQSRYFFYMKLMVIFRGSVSINPPKNLRTPNFKVQNSIANLNLFIKDKTEQNDKYIGPWASIVN